MKGNLINIIEYKFILPHGYCDEEAKIHTDVVMRLIAAMDEIAPLRDERVR